MLRALKVLATIVTRCGAALRYVAVRGGPPARASMRAVGRWLAAHRSIVAALSWRAVWWLAAFALLGYGTRLLGWEIDLAEPLDHRLVVPFAAGLLACGLVVVFAAERHLRWMATLLAAAHGSFAVLAWSALQG